jgi:hypothetical protein
MILNEATFNIMALSILGLIGTTSIATFHLMALSITTFSVTTLSINSLFVTLSINDIQHK